MWICPKCNKENQGHFCESCGAAEVYTEEKNNTAANANLVMSYGSNYVNADKVTSSGENKKLIMIACIVVLVVALIAAAFVLGAMVNENFDNANSEKSEKIEKKKKSSETDTEPEQNTGSEVPSDSGGGVALNPDADNKPGNEPDAHPTSGTTEAPKTEDITYSTYTNNTYGFYCAYPDNFNEVDPRGVNSLKTFVSEDGSAEMTIRASVNTNSVSTEESLNDFINAYGGNVSYEASGDTWYAISVTSEGRLFYRKLFNKNGYLCCMDFSMNEGEKDKYGPYVEYIEDNFKMY